MNRLIYLSLVVMLFAGCKAMRILRQQDITNYSACTVVTFKGRVPTIEIKINENPYSFLFDTGAGAPVLNDTLPLVNYRPEDFFSFGAYNGADRKKNQSTLFTASVTSKLFASPNKIFLFIKRFPPRCTLDKPYAGIIGLDAFFYNEKVLKMDFTNGLICNVTEAEKHETVSSETYQLVKSECKKNSVFIYLKIEGIEYKFKVDTGYIGSIIIPEEGTLGQPLKAMKTEYVGSLYSTVSSVTTGKEIFYSAVPIAVAGFENNSTVSVSSTIKAQNIGVEFIKGFDWIIDYNNNEVYIKKNNNDVPALPSWSGKYFTIVQSDKLFIILKEVTQKRFNIGDQIMAVNSEIVTKDNVCRLQKFLNEKTDWEMIDIVVKN